MTATTAVKEQLQTLPKSLEPTSTSSSKTVTVAVSSSCSGRPTSAVTTRLRTSARTTVAASSSRAPSASLSPPPPSASSVSFTKCNKRKVGRRTQRFVEMDRGQFWMLKSGKTVEDILFAASLQENATVKIRSFTLDFNCSATKALFSADEWIELLEANSFDLPRLPKTTEDYLGTIRQKLLSGEHVSMVPLPTKEDTFSCELAMTTCMKWARLYKKHPAPFAFDGLSEAFWARTSWPLLKDLFDDIPFITMLDGEKAGLELSKRKNKSRKTDLETSSRRRIGRKLDLVARDVLSKKD
ncbi:hypothetical protein BGZ58_000553 [Dissophora ornata]|nr:hypothetical protein BGZ58_000553 [Dissophora ornata]